MAKTPLMKSFAREKALPFPKKNGKSNGAGPASQANNPKTKMSMPAGYNDMGLACGGDDNDVSTSNPEADD
jgi:hypothetical protein